MANIKKRFFSIVLLGDFNPPILSHDFLINNKILPEENPEFGLLLKRSKAVDFYQVVPGFANIVYGPYEINIELNRFQVKDESGCEKFEESPSINLTKRYFKVLSYTPIKVGGFNLNYFVYFNNLSDKNEFLDNLFIKTEKLNNLFGNKIERNKGVFVFKFLQGSFKFDLAFINKSDPLLCNINVNYEFEFEDFSNMDSFLEQLNNVSIVEEKFNEIIDRID